MNVALVYDRVVKWGGAERVLLALHKLFPKAPLYTAVYESQKASWARVFDIRTSFLQSMPFVSSYHEGFAWAMPYAFESFSFDEYDLVISVTSAEAKGIITKPNTKHLCYCLTPTRYLWSHYNEYFSNSLLRTVSAPIVSHMRRWDTVAARRPDAYIAISNEVARRIKNYYGLPSTIIYPPIQSPSRARKAPLLYPGEGDSRGNHPFFLVVSRLVGYKRVDLVIEAFNLLAEHSSTRLKPIPSLVIVGTGRDGQRLRRLAGPTIYFTQDLTDEELAWYYEHAKALIMPQEEDFGLVAVEAQSYGTPVVAYKAGGALDTIIDGVTGMFFKTQSAHDIVSMIESYDRQTFNSENCRKNAEQFNFIHFKHKLLTFIDTLA